MNTWPLLKTGLTHLAYTWDWTVLGYFLALNSVYLSLYIASYLNIVKHTRRMRVPFQRTLFNSPMCLPISVLVPAFNEEKVIVDSVQSFLTLQYRQHEVIVINDGSTDSSLSRLIKEFDLEETSRVDPGLIPTATIRAVYRSHRHSNLYVIDKENGGKSDALNAGINFSRYPLFCSMDADSVLEPQALLRVVEPFMNDPQMVAVGATIRVANGIRIRDGEVEQLGLPHRALPLFQIVDYMRAFYAGRMGWSALGSIVLISGAFGLYKKEVVMRCKGYRRETVGEDMDLVVRMHRILIDDAHQYRMAFIPDPVCWTQAPETWGIFRSQRDRWQRGLAETLLHNRGMLFNPRYGRIGMWALPCHLIFELLGPLVEVAGYISTLVFLLLLQVDVYWLKLFFLAAILFGVILSLSAVLLEEMSYHRYPRVRQLMVLLLFAFLENFGFRQINAWWRCRAFFKVLWKQEGWGKMERESFSSVPEQTQA